MKAWYRGKRYFYLIIVLYIFVFVLAGCSEDGENGNSTSPIDQNLPATLHAILCIADHESDIGEAGIVDMNSMNSWLNQISQNTSMSLNRIVLKGTSRNLSQNALLNVIATLPVESNDVIVFYYTGHGGANEFLGGSKWPLMLFQNNELVDYAVISEVIKAKGARFVVTIADCCNNYSFQAKSRALVPKGTSDGYQSLFLKQSGYIVMSAASKGEFSLAGSDGGMFTNQFLSVFYANVSTDSPGWKTIMQQASQTLGAYESTGRLIIFHPQYDLDVSSL
ncbi:hypothetical protein U27_02745 [Candidatus Vecturithrix granuli]|uniref:Peptidase C14 caspase domain-containing protein n=1 Tax=Vecturithrix granuli TaxID=1499967 RepID=A0A081BTY1_VECG1|nr:hypothetical protein U27_02745 [Candidatus Vecturithrix granuli]